MAPRLRHLTALSLATFLVLGSFLVLHLRPDVSSKVLSASRKLFGQATLVTDEPDDLTESEFNDWHTQSQFRPVKQDVDGKSIKELCRSFPTHLLETIQPVLRTGHGVLEDRIRPQLQSVSACLENLLIFSDIDEEFDGYQIIDVIADLRGDFAFNSSQLHDYHVQREMAEQGLLTPGNPSHIKGWELDKFKFLPQISRAWHMRPEKRWYVWFEGDTFVVWDNVFRLLENYDPDVPWYFGSPSPGIEGSWMANGGPGYVLSREAVRRLTSHDFNTHGVYVGSKLSERWEDKITHDCCGDSVLGWAVHEDAKTNLSGLWPMFNPHSLHGVPFSDLYWCQPVISMHKTTTKDMLELWRWEQSHRDPRRPLLYADLANYLNLTEVTRRQDWQNSDWDGYSAAPDSPAHASLEACDTACKADDHCFQWTYHLKSCEFVRSFRLGAARAPEVEDSRPDEVKAMSWDHEDRRFIAGWDVEKIKRWMAGEGRNCSTVQWVRPSIERIF